MKTVLRLSPLFALLLIVGCQSGMITASVVDTPMRRVASRHDNYVAGDASLTPLEKSVILRDSATIRAVLDAAKPATQPTR